MSLHARQVAIVAAATGDQAEKVTSQMVAEKVIRIDQAEEILKGLQAQT
jgi:hydroxymethylglutaryl-CoA reductase